MSHHHQKPNHVKESTFNLRRWKLSDLDNLVKYANNWNVAKNLTDVFPHPYTAADGRKFIERVSKVEPIQVFAIETDGAAVGSIGVFPQTDIHRKNAEMGYWLAEPFWGKGIMTEAIQQALHHAFRSFEIDRVFARPFGSNLPSQRILEKNNFVLEARFNQTIIKNGVYHDELVYGIRRDDFKG